jgi:hypothetical protein
MKFGDILGETYLNEELSEDYKKVAHKVKIMYKTLRKGGFTIGKLIPDMVPFWTGFEIIDDKDVVITYELPTTYHLTSGNQMLAYEVIITGITINCERYPSLADDIDIREDILRRLARKFNNSLKGTFDEGEQIRFSIRKKHNVPSAYENMIDESVGDEQEKQRIINKSKLVYKSFRKGKVKVKVPPIFNNGEQVVVVADYELPKKFKIRLDFNHIFNRPVAFFIPIEDVKIEYDFKAKNDAVQNELLESFRHKIKMRFINFDSNCDMIFTKYKEAFKNTETYVVKEGEENDYTTLVKKAPTVFKALKKGNVSMEVDFLSDWRTQTQKKYTFNYDLGNVYIVETDPFENNYNVKILIPSIKINCEENPDLNNNQRIKMDILSKIKQKFNKFGLNVIQRATKFRLKHNGTWVKL